MFSELKTYLEKKSISLIDDWIVKIWKKFSSYHHIYVKILQTQIIWQLNLNFVPTSEYDKEEKITNNK